MLEIGDWRLEIGEEWRRLEIGEWRLEIGEEWRLEIGDRRLEKSGDKDWRLETRKEKFCAVVIPTKEESGLVLPQIPPSSE